MIIKSNKDEFENYLTDASYVHGNCDAVFIPETYEEISEIFKRANETNTPVSIFGGGTGTAAACVPESGIILSTERLNKILNIDESSKIATVQCGVLLKELLDAARERGLFYAPNPTETSSTLGGNMAANSSGARTFKYGSTRNYVEYIKVILPDGDSVNLERDKQKAVGTKAELITNSGKKYDFSFEAVKMPNCKNASGYYLQKDMDLMDLFIGCEGTLGLIAEAKFRLIDLPQNVVGGMAFFEDYDSMLKFVIDVRERSRAAFNKNINEISGIAFRIIEFFDSFSLGILKENSGAIPEQAACAIWFEQEFAPEHESAILENIYLTISNYTPLADNTIIAQSDSEHRELTEMRHSIPVVTDEMIARSGYRKIATDTAVPDEHFPEYFNFLISKLNGSGLENNVFGHIGNSHLHANIFPKSDAERDAALALYDELVHKAFELGGTVSAEHGVGKIKKKYLGEMYGNQAIADMLAIKKLFDPNLILSRGNVFVEY